MLGKLLKHEFRATSRTMLPMFGVVLALSLIVNLSFHMMDSRNQLLGILGGIFIAAFFIGLLIMCVMSVVVMVNRFYKNMLCDEGYLTFTLPVNVHQLVWSKLIVSQVWFLVTGIVAAVAVMLAVLIGNMDDLIRDLPSLSQLVKMLVEETGASSGQLTALLLQAVLGFILSSLGICLHFYAAMAIGHSFSNNKVLLSVVFFIAISFVMQFITSIGGIGMGVSVVEDMTATNGAAFFSVFQKMFLASVIWQFIEGAILYAATALCLKKHLNLS